MIIPPLSSPNRNKLNSNKISNSVIIGSHTSDNADECPDGLSCVSGKGYNNPYPSFWAVVITIGTSVPSYKQQLALPFANGYNSIAYRVYDGGNWFPWKYFAGSTKIS